jgi:hypothetical protein
MNYEIEKIEEVLTIINKLPFKGFEDASKVIRIYEILNSPIKAITPKEQVVKEVK